MNAGRLALSAALGALCAGCFLEELKVRCDDSRTDCHALNVANGIDDDVGADCNVYQCRSDGRGCELRPRDYDGDGYLDPQSCSDTDPKRLDCNDDPDGGADFNPDAEEQCDGVDNNCNGWIDEGALGGASTLESSVPLGQVDSLNYSKQGEVLLNVAVTQVDNSVATTALHVVGEGESPASPLQSASNNCTRPSGLYGRCTLREIALASAPYALIAVGVQTLGCAGTVRIGSRSITDGHALSWDGDSSKGNLQLGVASDSACGANTAHSPSIAISGMNALVTWRAVRGTPSELVGIGLAIDAGPGVDPRVRGLGEVRPLNLSGPNPGLDGAVIQPFAQGFFAAYDTPVGLEVAQLPELHENIDEVFASVGRHPIRSPGARHVALALASDVEGGEPQRLGLAWRVAQGNHSTLWFTQPSWASGSFTASDSVMTLRREAEILDGPAIAYVADGFRDDPEAGREGGWFVAWSERAGSRSKLFGIRVARAGDRALETPFVLAEDDLVAHPYVRQISDRHIGFAFTSGASERSLNIGSLACEPGGR